MAGHGRNGVRSVAGSVKKRETPSLGFWVFLAGNLLWIAWGFYSSAWALIVLQIALLAMNIRGAKKTEVAASESATHH